MPGRSACIRVKMFGSQSIATLANVPIRTVPTSSPFMRPICAVSSSPPRRIRRTYGSSCSPAPVRRTPLLPRSSSVMPQSFSRSAITLLTDDCVR